MKNLIPSKGIALFFFAIVVTACQDAAKIEDNTKNDPSKTEAKQETTDKKDAPATTAKINGTKWNADASKAKITFSVNGPFGTVNGSLTGLKSTILFDEIDLAASSFDASVDPKTISTGIKLRNRDLQKDKYLDSDKHPLISFHSEKIQKDGKGFKAIGDLTIKGVKKNIEIPFTFSETGNNGIFKGSFTIQRQDYSVGSSGGSIGNTISVKLEVPVTK
jgi:polyisoprenoid-binding protein YceI